MQYFCQHCQKPIIPGDLRRGDDWHADCYDKMFGDVHSSSRTKSEKQRLRSNIKGKARQRRDRDIKGPDGFLLGGIRKVRPDGTILFHRHYWQAPLEWIGENIWVHVMDGWAIRLEAAPPGMHVFDCRIMTSTWMKAPEGERNIELEEASRGEAAAINRKSKS